MRCKAIVVIAAILLAALAMTSPAQAQNGYPRAIGVGSPQDPYSPHWDPFYPYYFSSPGYYRGKDGHLYPAGPPAFPDGKAYPPGKLLPGRRPSRFYKPPAESSNYIPSGTPSNATAPANGTPGQP
ncbi:MAG TPA: hypothetical protein VKS79_05340 [Gemmataceae bacterium]|nr:hypothetical protein [Gemmataceae bacterium]